MPDDVDDSRAVDGQWAVGRTEGCAVCPDPIALSEGRTLHLHHLGAGDGPAMSSLYHRLGPDDVYRRFFTSALPDADWFEEWARVSERGGFGLLAVVTGGSEARDPSSTPDPTVVGEAGYARLCDGDGELGMAVDPTWRGWLGPWLLDALLQHADARGIPNIQALVLTDNRKMSTMVAARGVASMASPDWSTTRVSMSTRGRVPSWPGDRDGDRPHDRPRLLVESDRSRWAGMGDAVRSAFDVMVCRGPDHRPTGPTDRGCPLLRGERCPLLDGADVVVHLLDPSSPAATQLLDEERLIHSGLRMIDGFVTDPDGTTRRRPDADIIAELEKGEST